MRRGVLIALEGVDGSGKTTQAQGLASHLARFGRRVLMTREPTNNASGRRLREYLAGTDRHFAPAEELARFEADRREHVAATIEPALKRGWLVITDRYYYSSAAYQGALGLDPEEIIAANEAFAPRPDLAVIFTLPVALALARCLKFRGAEAQVSEDAPYLEKVAALYASFTGPHIRRLDASGPSATVLEGLLRAVLEVLADLEP
jgi:dTMP kinase